MLYSSPYAPDGSNWAEKPDPHEPNDSYRIWFYIAVFFVFCLAMEQLF